MKISTDKPPYWDRLVEAFGVRWDSGIIVTIGGIVYMKDPNMLTPDLAVHEEVHIRQQEGIDPEEWVDRFINDKQFRYDVEVEAYKAQADFLRETVKDPNELFCKLHWIYRCMERDYAGMITYAEAKEIV